MYVCEKCKQTSFIDNLIVHNEEKICSDCYNKIMADKFRWDNEKLAFQITIGCSYTDYETIVVPAIENLDAENCSEYDYEDISEAINELRKKWLDLNWGYDGEVTEFEVTEYTGNLETVKCDEFDIWIYESESYQPEFYARPFDNSPKELYFSCYFAQDCYQGQIYSKDFAYFTCDCCGRTICEQNPSNGWMSQVHYDDCSATCNKCYEEQTLENGINDLFDGSSIPGQFYDESEILDAGWTKEYDSILAGSGYKGYRDPNDAISLIQTIIDLGKKCLVNYENMAIGGLGGYVSIYSK